MHNQSFSANELSKCASYIEMLEFGCAHRDDLEKDLRTNMIPRLERGAFPIILKYEEDLCTNGQVNNDYFYQNLLLRKVCKNIQCVYSIKQANRNAIIRQVKSLLTAPCDLFVLRLDIHHFYESIQSNILINKIQEEGKVSAQTIAFIQEVFDTTDALRITGLPKGLNISAAFSEMYMRSFDYEVKRLDGVYYYARFVDDIIVFCNSKSSRDATYEFIKLRLKSIGLYLNHSKTNQWNSGTFKPLVYLGYSFSKNRTTQGLCVSIATAKLKKIKTRIVRSFMAYSRNGNYELLKKRIRYLTGNFRIRTTNSLLPQSVGLYYNYKYIDRDSNALDELQKFYLNILYCNKGELGSSLVLMSSAERSELATYSFVFGFRNKVHHSFTRAEISKITQIWR